MVERRRDELVADVPLSASNQPEMLGAIFAQATSAHSSDDIHVIERTELAVTDKFSRPRYPVADLRDAESPVVELEWSTPWARPNT
jgi:hypothetical protein